MERTCKNCKDLFSISQADYDFYARVDVPPPTLCYLCRMQRRLAYRNERCLYHRKCDLSGKQIISAFSIGKPNPVYDIDAWWSDEWDALSYGRDFDFTRPFFEQFRELQTSVPRLALQQQQPMENSRYCNCASRNKNCYLVFSTNECEDCYYGSWVNACTTCVDSLTVESCELCYQCVGCRECYNLKHSQDCISCSDSYFLRDCISCKNCFGCTSLAQKEFYLFNKPTTKVEYEKFLNSIDVGSHTQIKELEERISAALGVTTVKEHHGTQLENCSGDYLRNCRDVFSSFECHNSEELRYSMCLQNAKSSMDYSYWGQGAELIYESQACGYSVFNLRFCNLCWTQCSDLTYCDHCFSSQHCLGSVGLKKKQYCIFNKQYSPTDYKKLSSRIIQHMKETEEWGEFFPIQSSTFDYNESLAQEQIPLTKEEVKNKGWRWHEREDEQRGAYVGPVASIPDNIDDIDESICQSILKCEQTGVPYKIVPPELSFYKAQRIPLPRISPDARHAERLTKRNPRVLWDRVCENCQKSISTTYAPARPEKVFCEDCYQKHLY